MRVEHVIDKVAVFRNVMPVGAAEVRPEKQFPVPLGETPAADLEAADPVLADVDVLVGDVVELVSDSHVGNLRVERSLSCSQSRRIAVFLVPVNLRTAVYSLAIRGDSGQCTCMSETRVPPPVSPRPERGGLLSSSSQNKKAGLPGISASL